MAWFGVFATIFGAGFAAMKAYRRFWVARGLFCIAVLILGTLIFILGEELGPWISGAFACVVSAFVLGAAIDIVGEEEAKTAFRDLVKHKAHLCMTWTERQFTKEFRAGGRRRKQAMKGEPRATP